MICLSQIISLVAILITCCIYRWRNPRNNGDQVPPASANLPLIGETLQLLLPSPSNDLSPFFKNRFTRYCEIFRTDVAGKHVIIMSADPEFHRCLHRRDEELTEPWRPLDTFTQVFHLDIQ